MSSSDSAQRFAMFSLMFGLLCVPCCSLPLPAPLAIVFGHLALGHFGSRVRGPGYAWVGLGLGYLSGAVWIVLAILYAIGVTAEPNEVVPVEEVQETTMEAPAPSDLELPPPIDGPDDLTDVYAADGDGRYHTFFCSAVGDLDTRRVRLEAAEDAGFRRCEVCSP
jgi:hypothetical protein